MKKIILSISFITLLASVTASAQEIQNVFPAFWAKLTERNEELKSLAMPDVKTIILSGFDDEDLYIYTVVFNTSDNAQVFQDVLTKENIYFSDLTFPDNDIKIWLYHSDLLAFLMKAGIGL